MLFFKVFFNVLFNIFSLGTFAHTEILPIIPCRLFLADCSVCVYLTVCRVVFLGISPVFSGFVAYLTVVKLFNTLFDTIRFC